MPTKKKYNYVILHLGQFNEYSQNCSQPSVVEITKEKPKNDHYVKLTNKQLRSASEENLCASFRVVFGSEGVEKVVLILDGEIFDEGDSEDEYDLDDIIVEYQRYISGELPEDYYGNVE